MELNTIFMWVFVTIIAVGGCCVGYCQCFKNKESRDSAKKT